MKSTHYEELCRHFIAETLDFPASEIQSTKIKSPTHADVIGFKNQIDLYWETTDQISKYLNIGNAKWRDTRKIRQDAIMLLNQVKEDINAHKGFLFTNVGFTSGAIGVAMKYGIAIHIVKPSFDYSIISGDDSLQIQEQIQALARDSQLPIYEHIEVYKAYDFSENPEITSPQKVVDAPMAKPFFPESNRTVHNTNTKVITGPSSGRGIIKGGLTFKKG